MTSLQNEERCCRKSSVYNQTGQTYFQQLSAYNHMSAHLRRVLLAPCIVDSRNKRYARNKGLGSGRFSSRSKSLDKIRTQEDLIDGIAYDTQHHPLEVLRKSLECSSECHREVKEVGDACGRCNDWSARSRVGVTSCTIAQRTPVNSEAGGTICQCLRLQPCKPCSTPALKRVSPKSSRLNGGCRRVRAPLIVDGRDWKKSTSVRSRVIKAPPSRSNVGRSERSSYTYDSSFESSSGTSTAPGSPIFKMAGINHDSRPETPADISNSEMYNNNSETAARSEEAKYAKFIYDITQEITSKGLYTDDDLHTIFKKHIEMNSDTLDKNKMQSEIHRLKMVLNVRVSSEDEEVNDVERFASTGKFAKFSLEKTQYNIQGKMRHNETSTRSDQSRRPKSAHGKCTVVLVDPNPQLMITEQDVVQTLREMKLDPRQIQSICKSLQKRSRDVAPSPMVKNYAETSSVKRAPIRSNSPTDSKNGSRAIDVHRSNTDRKLQNASESPKRNPAWQCRCEDSPTTEESQPKVQSEIEVQPSSSRSQADRLHIAFTNSQPEELSDPSISARSVRSKESRKIHGAAENNEQQLIEESRSYYASSTSSKRLPQESLTTSVSLVSNKSFGNKNKSHEDAEKMKMAKPHTQRMQMMQDGYRSEDESSIESTDNGSDEEQKRKLNIKMKTYPSTKQKSDRIAHHPKSLPDLKLESKEEPKNDKKGKATKTRTFHNSSPPNEAADIEFVSHSRFMNNLRKGEVSSLPDISERSEGITEITEEVATDENVKKIGATTPHRSHIEEITDHKMVNFPKNNSQLDVMSFDNESSDISENIDALEVSSLTDGVSGTSFGRMVEVVMSQTRGIPESEDDSNNKLSTSPIVQNSGDSEIDEDSDENKQVVVAALNPSSSSGLLPTITLSSPNHVVDEKQTIVADKTSLSLDLSPRISENEEYESSNGDETPKNSAKKKRSEESYSLKVERRLSSPNSVNKSSDTSSIKSELDQQETLNSTSEIQVEEEKFRVPSGATNSQVENGDEESQKFFELAKQSDRNSMKIHDISDSKLAGVYRPDKDSSYSERNLQEKSEDSEKQKEKQQIRYTRFGRLIGKGNRQRNLELEETSETRGKKSQISEKDKELQSPNFPDESITTASDISFLRKQNFNDSAPLSVETSLDPMDRHSEPTRSNSREIERYVAKSRSLGNSYTSMYSNRELTSGNFKPRPEVTHRRQVANQNENSISKRMKAAVGNLIKRSSKYTQMDGNNPNLPSNVSSRTTSSGLSPRSQVAGTVVSSTLAINSRNSGCVCVLTMKKIHRNTNCRPDCRGRGYVCDQRCSLFNRILQ